MSSDATIGVDLGGTHLRSALADSFGRIMASRKAAVNIHMGAGAAVSLLIAECRALAGHAQSHAMNLRAIGLGVAGKIDAEAGVVLFSPNLRQMEGYPLVSSLAKAMGVPVVMENDANAFGLGEAFAGAGKGLSNWIGVTLGTGVGGCLVLGGRLWHGDGLGFSGEIGHTAILEDGPPCACGLKGCLESLASGSALVRGAGELISGGKATSGRLYDLWRDGNLSAMAIYECATAGDPWAQSLFVRMGRALGISLGNLFTVLGIRHAVIGGGVSAAWDQFIGPVKESLAGSMSMLAPGDAVILKSRLGDSAALIGAARLAFESVNR
jgi:glucokinase